MYNNLRNLVEQVKKVFCFKNWLLEQIDLVISIFLQNLGLQPLNSKKILDH